MFSKIVFAAISFVGTNAISIASAAAREEQLADDGIIAPNRNEKFLSEKKRHALRQWNVVFTAAQNPVNGGRRYVGILSLPEEVLGEIRSFLEPRFATTEEVGQFEWTMWLLANKVTPDKMATFVARKWNANSYLSFLNLASSNPSGFSSPKKLLDELKDLASRIVIPDIDKIQIGMGEEFCKRLGFVPAKMMERLQRGFWHIVIGTNVLHGVCETGDAEIVKLLINDFGASIDALDQFGFLSLHRACVSGNQAVVQVLLDDCGVDPAATDYWDWTPLHNAAYGGHVSIVKLLITALETQYPEKFPQILHVVDEDGKTPLNFAQVTAIADLLTDLVTGIDPQAIIKAAVAVPEENEQVLPKDEQWLAKTKQRVMAPWNIVFFRPEEPTEEWLEGRREAGGVLALPDEILEEVRQFLVPRMATPNEVGQFEMVMWCISNNVAPGRIFIFDWSQTRLMALLQAGAGDADGFIAEPALVDVLTDWSNEIVIPGIDKISVGLSENLELVLGFKPYQVARESRMFGVRMGNSPLHCACLAGDLNIARVLIDFFGADINTPDTFGALPLHGACVTGRYATVKALIDEFGADPAKLDINEKNALHFAAYHGHLDITKVLIDEIRKRYPLTYLEKINVVDDGGSSPMDYAMDYARMHKIADVVFFLEQWASPILNQDRIAVQGLQS
eukprot:gene185-344_t